MIKRNKKVLLACAALTLAGLLGACSSSSGPASENSSVKESRTGSISEETVQGNPEMTETETTAAEGMRTVETDKGPVEIPVNPQVIDVYKRQAQTWPSKGRIMCWFIHPASI